MRGWLQTLKGWEGNIMVDLWIHPKMNCESDYNYSLETILEHKGL
jgi:hypothetical protein